MRSSPASSTKNYWHAPAVLAALVVTALQLFVASRLTVQVPLVDGWAVWNRVMLYNQGAMGPFRYLLTPHGAHLHLAVYSVALLDERLAGAHQYLMQAVSYAAIAAIIVFFTWFAARLGNFRNASTSMKVLVAVAIAFLVTNLGDTETLLQPFQVVMTVSRLAYVVLTWLMIGALRRGTRAQYVAVLIACCIAQPLHGAGYIFAAVLFALHVLLARRLPVILLGLLPFVTGFVIQKHYGGASELSHVAGALSLGNLVPFLKASAGYFASPFQYAAPWVGYPVLLVPGFAAMAVTAAVTVYGLWRTVRYRVGNRAAGRDSVAPSDELVYGWALGLALLMSAAAAALLCMVRVTIESTLASVEPYLLVLTSPRYGAWSCIAYLMALGVALSIAPVRRAARGVAVVLAVAFVITGLVATLVAKRIYTHEHDLQVSVAGITFGLSPLDPAADGIWPGAVQDGYWRNALPETVAYLRLQHKGPWRDLPVLHAVADPHGATTLPISDVHADPLHSDKTGNRCALSGNAPDSNGLVLERSAVVPVVDASGTVVGFAALLRPLPGMTVRRVQGFVECSAATASGARDLRVVAGQARWTAPASSAAFATAPLNVTDATWRNGVATAWAGLTFPDTQANRRALVEGAVLKFDDGTLRVINKMNDAHGFLNVFLDGGVLDGSVVGYPRKVEVVQ